MHVGLHDFSLDLYLIYVILYNTSGVMHAGLHDFSLDLFDFNDPNHLWYSYGASSHHTAVRWSELA